jgi:hypothetical protein
MVNPPRAQFGGVRADGILDAGSLIFRPIAFLPTTFLALGGGRGVTSLALRLPAHVFGVPALGPPNEASTESALKARSEIGTTGIGGSPSKLGMPNMKLSKACSKNKQSINNQDRIKRLNLHCLTWSLAT